MHLCTLFACKTTMYHFRTFIVTIKGIQSPINSITATETCLHFSLSIDTLRFPLSIIRSSSFLLSAQRFLDLLGYFEYGFQFGMLPSIPLVIHTKEAHIILLLLMIFILLDLPFNLTVHLFYFKFTFLIHFSPIHFRDIFLL